jgi:Uma2 family endonuclease
MAIAPDKLRRVPGRLVAALHRAGMPESAIHEIYHLDHAAIASALSGPSERLSVEDLDYLPDDGYHYELWAGELVRMSPTKGRHTVSAGRLVKHLGAYLVQHPIGEICIAEGGFRTGPEESLRCPDAGYVSNERLADVPLDDYFPFAPDIAIEVWSPDNTEQEMNQKASDYLAHGARAVWVLRPRDRTVRVHRPDKPVEILRDGDLLTGDDILPGFSVAFSALFP